MSYDSPYSLSPKKINYELVKESMALAPKRICFASYHKEALRKSNNERFLGKFVIPFKETIYPIFECITKLTLINKFDSYFYSIKIGEDHIFEAIQAFITQFNEIVFLRDCLDLSISLGENLSDKNELTSIGKLEHEAKYNNDNSSIKQLAEICYDFIIKTPYYNAADLICAVPPSEPGKANLPRKVVILLKDLTKKDISETINWSDKKPPLKDLELEKKWQTLEEFELLIKTNIKNKSIILIDDLYQSGTTMQYIAMKLKEAGASLVYGLSLVKARNDKDYV